MAAIIVDIDGTLLNSGNNPIKKTVEWVNSRASEYTIIIVTGRPRSTEARTRAALKSAGIRFSSLHMNPGSTRDSSQYKRQEAEKIKSRTRVVLAIDDNPSARSAYRAAGIRAVSPRQLTESMLKLISTAWNRSLL